MLSLRRRLASCALVLCLVQVVALFAAPVAACCDATALAGADCCPAGTHAPGQCPLHRGSRAETRGPMDGDRASTCRLTCSHPAASVLLLMPVGVLESPLAVRAPILPSRAAFVAAAHPVHRSVPPSSPPPKA